MAQVDRAVLYSARTTDGTSSSIALKPGFRDYTLWVSGVPNGATVTIQGSHDDSLYAALSSATTVTAVGQVNFLTAVPYLRCVISASGGSTSLTVCIFS